MTTKVEALLQSRGQNLFSSTPSLTVKVIPHDYKRIKYVVWNKLMTTFHYNKTLLVFIQCCHFLSRVTRKHVFGFSDPVRHKPVCSFKENGQRFKLSEVEKTKALISEIKGADQLCSYCAAYLRLFCRICKKPDFS